LQSTDTLSKHHVEDYTRQIKHRLIEHGIDPHVIDGMSCETFLEPFSAADRRYDYYIKMLPYVAPVKGTNISIRMRVLHQQL
jgi:hypothetical protein